MLKKKVIAWMLVFAWAGLIFFLSHQPQLPSPGIVWWDYIFKKSAHMFVFGMLFTLLLRALSPKTQFKQATVLSYIVALYLTGLYAVSDEFHQSFTVGRHPSVLDIGYDLTGAFIAFNLLRYRYGFGPKPRN